MITNDIERLMNRELSPKDILSIGGFLMEQFGRIPESGEAVEVNGIRFTVEQVTDRAIETVRVRRLPDVPGEQKE
jgi:CBS domain containing-hemolysin-like protein